MKRTFFIYSYQGYTLFEVLIVLLLITALSSIAFSTLHSLLTKNSQKQDIEQLSSAIEFGRSHALLTLKRTLLCPMQSPSATACANSWHKDYAVFECAGEKCFLLRYFQLFDQTAELSSSRASVEFTSNGYALLSNQRIRYYSAKNHFKRDFIINNAGRLRTE